jgi:hypothetical protein
MAHGWKLKACDWEYLFPGIWARLVLFVSDWAAESIDKTFFPARRRDAEKDGAGMSDVAARGESVHAKGSSAFRRYLACKSKINFSHYGAADNPFLQIDSCWPGTFRYLAAPYVGLFTMPASLLDVQKLMVRTDIRFRRLCFAGKENAMRRTYAPAKEEADAIAAAWRGMDSTRLRIRYFPDILVVVLGWIKEAIILGDRSRLAFVKGYEVLPKVFGISFTQLEFLETEFAGYLDRWVQLSAIENFDRDPYRLSVEYEAMDWILRSGRCPSGVNLLDMAGLLAAVYRGETMSARIFEEDLLRQALPHAVEPIPGAPHRVSWDRSELLRTAAVAGVADESEVLRSDADARIIKVGKRI